MAENTNSNQGAQAGAKVAQGMVTDKNKSNEQYITDAEALYIVPTLVRQKFPDLVKLIFETESMDIEEREYWLQIMPIMSEEQIVKFRDILVNERDQLAKLDKEYQSEMSRMGAQPVKPIDEKKMKEEIAKIQKEEKHSEVVENSEEQELLKKLEEI